MKNKKYVLMILALALIIAVSLTAYASNGEIKATLFYKDIKMTLDGATITPRDADGKVVEPFIYNGTTYLPARAVCNALGKDVEWDATTNTIKIITPNSGGSTSSGEGSGTVGEYEISILGFDLTSDYEGKPSVLITYKWTNNSSEAESFMFTFKDQVFQNGIECETAIISGNDNYDSEPLMTDVKPGYSLTVKCAYVLQDTENPIEVEVSELFNFESNPPMVTQAFEIK
jgi:hypothetical protein